MPDKTENHTLRLLKKIHSKLEDHDERFNTIDERFDAIDERLERLEAVFAGLSFLQVEERGQIEQITQRLDRIEDELGLADAPAE